MSTPQDLVKKFHLDGETRLDAAAVLGFARDLEEIDRQTYSVEYANLEAFELVSAKTDLDPATDFYTYRMFDARGVAQMTSSYASGSPRVDIGGTEYTFKIRALRNSYGYNLQELRASARMGIALESERALVAREIMNEAINRRALIGDAEFGIIGLFNQPVVPLVLAGTGGTGTPNTLWSGKTSDLITADIFNLIDSIPTLTKEREHAKRVVMPHSRMRYLSQMKIALGGVITAETVLGFMQRSRPGVEFRGANYIDTAGAGGVARIMAYDFDPKVVQLLLPIAFESLPPERRSMEWVIENHARMGSVVMRRPLSAAYMDGI